MSILAIVGSRDSSKGPIFEPVGRSKPQLRGGSQISSEMSQMFETQGQPQPPNVQRRPLNTLSGRAGSIFQNGDARVMQYIRRT